MCWQLCARYFTVDPMDFYSVRPRRALVCAYLVGPAWHEGICWQLTHMRATKAYVVNEGIYGKQRNMPARHALWCGQQRHTRTCLAGIFRSEIQDGRHLENLFWTSSEWKGKLFGNLVWSIGEICRLEIVKIVPIGNSWWPLQPPSWKSISNFSGRSVDSKLNRKYLGDL